MAKKAPNAKGRRSCVFCGDSSAKISGEHMWPNWAKDLLPDRATKREWNHIGDRFRTVTAVRKDFERQGSPKGITVRGPCEPCNNGWMGALEEEAKPILQRICFENGLQLTRREAKTLTQWMFLKFSVNACSLGNELPSISAEQRAAFMRSREIPVGFVAAILKHDVDDWRDRDRWNGLRLNELGKDQSPIHNIVAYLMGFGNCAFWMSYQVGFRMMSVTSLGDYAVKIWPLRTQGGVDLPKLRMNEAMIGALAEWLPSLARAHPHGMIVSN